MDDLPYAGYRQCPVALLLNGQTEAWSAAEVRCDSSGRVLPQPSHIKSLAKHSTAVYEHSISRFHLLNLLV